MLIIIHKIQLIYTNFIHFPIVKNVSNDTFFIFIRAAL